eukprot:augustus_masked-scaffold_38-processed-gene-0.45-mRNA-1 protein AED:1.00 eAED:1.00 QI:0/0/0/0/1/1/2/0/647
MTPQSKEKTSNEPLKDRTEPSNPQENIEKDDQSQNPSTSPQRTASPEKTPTKASRKSPRSSGGSAQYGPKDLENIKAIIKERKRMQRIQKDIAEKLAKITEVEERLKDAKETGDTKSVANSRATSALTSRSSITQDEDTQSQITTLTKKSRSSKASKVTILSKAKSYKSKTSSKKSEYTGKSKKDEERTSADSSIDPWSDTGSTYVDRKFHMNNFEPYNTPSSAFPHTARGYPVIHITPPKKLSSLTYEEIKSFVHEVETTLPNVPMNILSLISSGVTESLQQRGVNIKESHSIMNYLKKHLQNYYKAERSRSIFLLQTVLKWPTKKMLPEDQIYTFMDEAMKILKFLNKEQMNRNRKKILKTILSKVPEAFNFNVDEMLLDVKELDLLKLRSKMIKRRFVLREKAVKQKQTTGLKTSHLPPYHNEEYRKRKQLRNVGCIVLRRIGNSATPITLMLFHLSSKQYTSVKGIADTGADYNVSNLETAHFEKLDRDPDNSEVTPVLLANVQENMPEEFNEIGIGEGNIQIAEEDKEINNMINVKLSESTFNLQQQNFLKDLFTKYRAGWGLRQSNAQMSNLTPIEVELKPGSSILRSDGYHQTKEEERFLELKFEALRQAGIVSPAKNPVWGHPVLLSQKRLLSLVIGLR